jgi:hypothetical protein
MGEKSNQIERQIQAERGQLGQNLNELQSKVEEVTNWRAQFQKRPLLMMGVAVSGGLLLASMTGRRSKRGRRPAEDWAGAGDTHQPGTELQKNKALETFDLIKGAMIGVAANTFQGFLGQIIPGFKEQFQKTAQEKRAAIGPGGTGSAHLAANTHQGGISVGRVE